MKKAVSILGTVFFVMSLIPIVIFLIWMFIPDYGCSFENTLIYVILAFAVGIAAVIVGLVGKEKINNVFLRIVFTVIAPTSLLFYGLLFSKILDPEPKAVDYIIAIFSLLNIFIGFFLSFKYGYMIVSFVFAVCTFVLSFYLYAVGHVLAEESGLIGSEVVQSIHSPDNKHRANVVKTYYESGDDKFSVEVEEPDRVWDLFFIRIYKEPYWQPSWHWDGYVDMHVQWKDNDTLIINSSEYDIDDLDPLR